MESTGPLKIIEGVFVGDEFASQDLEFIIVNKVTHIINCASVHIPNHWEPIGIKYISFAWQDSDSQLVLDSAGKVFSKVKRFIKEATDEGESVMIHSIHGRRRPICLLTAYLMHRYHWVLSKALEFMKSKVKLIDLGPGMLKQLRVFEKKIKGKVSSSWSYLAKDVEETVAVNTFLNSQMNFADFEMNSNKNSLPKVNWAQEHNDHVFSRAKNPIVDGFVKIKSCFKGADKTEKSEPLRPSLPKTHAHIKIRTKRKSTRKLIRKSFIRNGKKTKVRSLKQLDFSKSFNANPLKDLILKKI